MYDSGISVDFVRDDDSFVRVDGGSDFVVVPRTYWDEARTKAALAGDLMRVGTEAVNEADSTKLRLERQQARLATLMALEEEKDTYEKAFYRMRDRVVVLVRAIRGHRSAIRCGGKPDVTNIRLWSYTRDYPGRK